jgi:hypothetical protein
MFRVKIVHIKSVFRAMKAIEVRLALGVTEGVGLLHTAKDQN